MYNILSYTYVYLLALIPYSNPLFNIYFNIIQRDICFFKTEYPGKRTLLVHSSGRQPVFFLKEHYQMPAASVNAKVSDNT
jgi:hypothetical protein